MSRESVQLLGPTTTATSPTNVGLAVPAAGQAGHTAGLHTIAIRVMNFQGRIYIEGSLALVPGPTDWFALPPNGPTPYIQFPSDGSITGITGTFGFSFQCNCLWLRARVDQTYLFPPNICPISMANYGLVDTVLANFSMSGIGVVQDTGVPGTLP